MWCSRNVVPFILIGTGRASTNTSHVLVELGEQTHPKGGHRQPGEDKNRRSVTFGGIAPMSVTAITEPPAKPPPAKPPVVVFQDPDQPAAAKEVYATKEVSKDNLEKLSGECSEEVMGELLKKFSNDFPKHRKKRCLFGCAAPPNASTIISNKIGDPLQKGDYVNNVAKCVERRLQEEPAQELSFAPMVQDYVLLCVLEDLRSWNAEKLETVLPEEMWTMADAIYRQVQAARTFIGRQQSWEDKLRA